MFQIFEGFSVPKILERGFASYHIIKLTMAPVIRIK